MEHRFYTLDVFTNNRFEGNPLAVFTDGDGLSDDQMLAIALGAKTLKMRQGHHGANHPVKDLRSGRVEITAQNHGFSVDPASLSENDVEYTHINLNDQTLEGFRHRREPMLAVQYHPEAAPGPHDSFYLFGEFMKMIDGD